MENVLDSICVILNHTYYQGVYCFPGFPCFAEGQRSIYPQRFPMSIRMADIDPDDDALCACGRTLELCDDNQMIIKKLTKIHSKRYEGVQIAPQSPTPVTQLFTNVQMASGS